MQHEQVGRDGEAGVDAGPGDLRAELTALLDGDGPSIALQPIVHIQSRKVVGREALARFPGPRSPAEWFGAAHAAGVGAELELRAVERVFEQIDAESGGDDHTFLSVNVSPQVLVDPRLMQQMRAGQTGRLAVEITEQTALPQLSILRPHLTELRNLGVRIAVEVSSLDADARRCIAICEPDFVKLGVDLVASLVRADRPPDLDDGLLAECRQGGLFVIAVGVEQQSDLAALAQFGVDAAQGYFLGEPQPVQR